jgi:hypothetical protein
MTGRATGIVVTIQHKILVVVECCRQPFFLAMALGAVASNLLV